MGETLLNFPRPIAAPDGTLYEGRISGGRMPDGMWQGWIEFVPVEDGEPLRSARETTQPNRTDLVYWATGLTDIYLEGSLNRTLAGPVVVPIERREPSIFGGPAPAGVAATARNGGGTGAVLDPFSVYEKGEPMLRRQLSALAAWHLVNIALEYELTDLEVQALNDMTPAALIEVIVNGVRSRVERPYPA